MTGKRSPISLARASWWAVVGDSTSTTIVGLERSLMLALKVFADGQRLSERDIHKFNLT
jgi:hypothetical protein